MGKGKRHLEQFDHALRHPVYRGILSGVNGTAASSSPPSTITARF